MIRLPETREIPPYVWVHPDERMQANRNVANKPKLEAIEQCCSAFSHLSHIGSIRFIFRPTGLSHGQRLQQFGRHQINDHDDAGPDEHHKGGASKPTSRRAGFGVRAS
jgi:hypothetical protein